MQKNTVAKLLWAFGIVFVAGVVFYVAVMEPAFAVQQQVRALPVENIAFASLKDGLYEGTFDYNQVSTRVEIMVNKHRIEDLRVLGSGNTDQAKRAIAELKRKIVDSQSLEVDVVSGATTSSKAFLKSVEDALKKGL